LPIAGDGAGRHIRPAIQLLPVLMRPAVRFDPFSGRPEQSDALAAAAGRGADARHHPAQHLQPAADRLVEVTNLGMMRAVPEVKETVNLATQYMKAGYDPDAFMAASPRSSATTISPRCTPSSTISRSSRNTTPPASPGALQRGEFTWTSGTTAPSISCPSTIAPRSRRGCSVSRRRSPPRVAASKQVTYDGLKLALTKAAPREAAGILVDEQYDAAILRDARAHGLITCAPAEKSGQEEFQFEYGDRYAEHIAEFNPTFVKVLVRYNPESDEAMNRRQAAPGRKNSERVNWKV
jgi:hypothetical protein